MNLTPLQRECVRLKYGGRCAYCGNKLGSKWHADHLEAVQRAGRWVFGKYVTDGTMHRPEHDHLDNMMPACIPCNIHKSDFKLESWRKYLEQSAERLRNNYSTYRHALRFGLVAEAPPKVTFYFERYGQPQRRTV